MPPPSKTRLGSVPRGSHKPWIIHMSVPAHGPVLEWLSEPLTSAEGGSRNSPWSQEQSLSSHHDPLPHPLIWRHLLHHLGGVSSFTLLPSIPGTPRPAPEEHQASTLRTSMPALQAPPDQDLKEVIPRSALQGPPGQYPKALKATTPGTLRSTPMGLPSQQAGDTTRGEGAWRDLLFAP